MTLFAGPVLPQTQIKVLHSKELRPFVASRNWRVTRLLCETHGRSPENPPGVIWFCGLNHILTTEIHCVVPTLTRGTLLIKKQGGAWVGQN